mmetsp:Transcript_31993/g.83717  ORF Transcript_31993/g.83717 Transcript_31993/m.83717 type:complete len:601 (-) Transcript_31993:504-2306(-)
MPCGHRSVWSVDHTVDSLEHHASAGALLKVEEEELLVGGERPHRRRHDGLGVVADLADVDHGLEAEHARELGLLQGGLGLLDGGDGALERLNGGLELRSGLGAGLIRRRQHVLLDHVDHALRLDLDGASVVVVHDVRAREGLGLGHDAHVLEEFGVLVGRQALARLDAGVDAPHATLARLDRPLLGVAVAVEDDLPRVGERGGSDVDGLLAGLNLVSEDLERLADGRAEHSVDHRHVLGRARRAELEAVAAVGKGRGAVAVLSRDADRRDAVDAEVDVLLGRGVLLAGGARLEGLEEARELVTEVRRDDRRRRLARAEAEVVAGRGDGHAHEVAVLVDGLDDGRHDHSESLRRAGRLRHILDVEQVDAVRRADREVVVLARAVDAVERLLVENTNEAVLLRNLFDELHEGEVLVDLGGGDAEVWRALVLVGRDLAVARLEGAAHLEALVHDLLHTGKGDLVERRHVVVAHLLAAGGRAAHDGAAGHLQVRTLVVRRARDEEELLLQADVGDDAVDLPSEELHEALALHGDGAHRLEQRRLLVEGRAVPRDENCRDEDGIAANEDGRRRVERRVAAGGVGGTEAAVLVRGAVGLTLDELVA